MTTTTLSTTTTRRDTAPLALPRTSAVTLDGTIRSEWIKLRSVRPSVTGIAAASTAMISSGAITAAVQAAAAPGTVIAGQPIESFAGDPPGLVLNRSGFASLAIGAVGVLIASNEYATGQIRTPLAAVPARLPVLVAEAAAVTAIVFAAWVVVPLLIAAVLIRRRDA